MELDAIVQVAIVLGISVVAGVFIWGFWSFWRKII